MQRRKPLSICWGLDLVHTVYVSALKTYEESEAPIPPKHDFMTDFRASHEKLKHSWNILSFRWHLLLIEPCMHTHTCTFHGCLCAIEVWFLCSLRWGRQLNPVSFLLFCSMDPPWISALTPDERHFISELLTQFHRVHFLSEGKIKKIILFNTFL